MLTYNTIVTEKRKKQEKSPRLIKNNFLINQGDIFFVIYHKHVSDRQWNILTPLVGKNNFSNSEASFLITFRLIYYRIIYSFFYWSLTSFQL